MSLLKSFIFTFETFGADNYTGCGEDKLACCNSLNCRVKLLSSMIHCKTYIFADLWSDDDQCVSLVDHLNVLFVPEEQIKVFI